MWINDTFFISPRSLTYLSQHPHVYLIVVVVVVVVWSIACIKRIQTRMGREGDWFCAASWEVPWCVGHWWHHGALLDHCSWRVRQSLACCRGPTSSSRHKPGTKPVRTHNIRCILNDLHCVQRGDERETQKMSIDNFFCNFFLWAFFFSHHRFPHPHLSNKLNIYTHNQKGWNRWKRFAKKNLKRPKKSLRFSKE